MNKSNKIITFAISVLLIAFCFLCVIIAILILDTPEVQQIESSTISNDNEIASAQSIINSEISNTSTTVNSQQETTSNHSTSSFPIQTQPNNIIENNTNSATASPSIDNNIEDDISAENTENFALEELEKNTFKQLYTLTETQYINQLSSEILTYKTQLSDWEEKSQYYNTQKMIDQSELMENYANMGLLNSGQYQSALSRLNSKYQALQSECTSNINHLNDTINTLNTKIQNPDPNEILAILAVSNGLTAQQAVEKYNKYMQ